MNPSTAFARVFVDELARCGVREAVLAPGSRSTPLALALFDHPAVRLHVRLDERSAGFLGLGLAKASRRPSVLVCTSGTAAAHFHAAVVEADEAGVPLIVLTADRPPELRGTGTNQTIDQLKLYGGAVRWFCEAGVPEARPGMARYWRSLAGRTWALASGAAGGFPGPVQVNLPLREPLVPDAREPGPAGGDGAPGGRDSEDGSGPGDGAHSGAGARSGDGARPGDRWPDSLEGRPDGAPWTRFGAAAAPDRDGSPAWLNHRPAYGPYRGTTTPGPAREPLRIEWAERGVLVCGDGDYDTGPLLELAEAAGWPVLAEPSSGARRGPNALSAYGYLLGAPGFAAGHEPEVIISAGRPGLSRSQQALLRGRPGSWPARHVVLAQGPGRWADPGRSATDVAAAVALSGPRPGPGRDSAWLAGWRRADGAARRAADEILGSGETLTEPGLGRDLAAALPDGALLWAASSMPVRDLDLHMAPRTGIRVLSSRGASGVDGLVSSAIGAALAHQAAGGGRPRPCWGTWRSCTTRRA